MVRRADLRNKTRRGRIAKEPAVAPEPVPEPVVEEVPALDLSALKKSELIELAAERGLPVKGTKKDLIALLSQSEGGEDGTSEEEE